MKTEKISNRGSLIFDIEIDKFQNLYYASYDQKNVYVIKHFIFNDHHSYSPEIFCKLQYVDRDKVFSNILMLNDEADLLFIRVDKNKILVYEVGEANESERNHKVDLISNPKQRFIELKIKGKIIEMMSILDRFVVLTVLGKIRIYVGTFDEKKMNKCDASIDLGLEVHEKVTAACISRNCNYMCVATQKHDNNGKYHSRLRLYEIITAKKLKFLTNFDEELDRDPNAYVMHV